MPVNAWRRLRPLNAYIRCVYSVRLFTGTIFIYYTESVSERIPFNGCVLRLLRGIDLVRGNISRRRSNYGDLCNKWLLEVIESLGGRAYKSFFIAPYVQKYIRVRFIIRKFARPYYSDFINCKAIIIFRHSTILCMSSFAVIMNVKTLLPRVSRGKVRGGILHASGY